MKFRKIWMSILLAAAALPAQATLVTFGYTGAAQTWTAPTGVRTVNIAAYGAQGGTGYYAPGANPSAGGLGGLAKGTLAVASGQNLTVMVGGQGSSVPNNSNGSTAGGFNGGGAGGKPLSSSTAGGGGGGGASDVRVNGADLADRVIVAGGGGGSGGRSSGFRAGGGGGGGGGYYGGGGGSAGPSNNIDQAGGGGAGTASAGGAAGGTGSSSGSAGGLGQGGTGGRLSGDAASFGPAPAAPGTGGAGGGTAGGTGVSNPADGTGAVYVGSGGGGGSSYVGGVSGGSTATGARQGNGLVTFEYVVALLGGSLPGGAVIDFGGVDAGGGILGGLGFDVENVGEATSVLSLLDLTGLDNGFSLASGSASGDLTSDGVAGTGQFSSFRFNFDPTGLAAGLYSTTVTLHSDAGDLSYTLQATVPEPATLALAFTALGLALTLSARRHR